MYTLLHMLSNNENLLEYKDGAELQHSYQQFGCQGVEIICCGNDDRGIIAKESIFGLHLPFYSYWVEFWRRNKEALQKEFGSAVAWESFYQGKDGQDLVRQLQQQMDMAKELGIRYVVFHVSDVSIEECYTYQFGHSDMEVVQATIELVNQLLEGKDYSFEFLMENLWWPGLTFTDPKVTKMLLEGIQYKKTGFMLDIGHLLHTNLDIRDQEEGCQYIHEMLDQHKEILPYIRGIHLHQTISGVYVKEQQVKPLILADDFYDRFAQCYQHVAQIDAHLPMTTDKVLEIIERIDPEYLVYEFTAVNRATREGRLKEQAQVVQQKVRVDV